ncbi:MAG: hypothetical protein NVS2B7_36210 [Herpetosiphon sp.]
MTCPHCSATPATELTKRTRLGYRTFHCSVCRRQFNERTGTPYNYLEFPTDIVLLVVIWRLRYKLSLRDLAEMFLHRGFEFTHEAVREWETRFAPLVAGYPRGVKLRTKRKGRVGRSWYVDETYIQVGGVWTYLYRAIDRDGNLVDVRLSEHRDMDGAKQFFLQAVQTVGHAPKRVTTDGHDSYPRAIRETLGEEVVYRTSPYLNNRLEQDHRGIKQRPYPMRGFGMLESASRFCRGFDEQRQYFRLRTMMCQPLPPLAEQRREYCARFQGLMGELAAA